MNSDPSTTAGHFSSRETGTLPDYRQFFLPTQAAVQPLSTTVLLFDSNKTQAACYSPKPDDKFIPIQARPPAGALVKGRRRHRASCKRQRRQRPVFA